MKTSTKEAANNQDKPYHHGDLRQVLLDEAAQLIREQGEKGLSMRALANRGGVSRTAPYHHFKDKQELLCAIAEEGFRRFVGLLTVDGGELTEQRIQRFIQEYLDFAMNHTEYYDLMFGGHLWKSSGITEALKQQSHSSFKFYVDQVRSWQSLPQIRQDLDPQRYAQVSWSTMHGMSRLLIDGIYLESTAMGPMCEQAAKMFWRELTIGT